MSRSRLLALLAGAGLALGCATSVQAQPADTAADTEDRQSAPAEAPAGGPVFPSILSEGKRVVPTPAEQQAERQAQRQKAADDSVRAAVDNMRRIGIFAAEAVLALLGAGLVGGLIAAGLALWRERRKR